MDYIKELNAFRDFQMYNRLTTSQIVLWYALIQTNNKAGWRESFTVANPVLQFMTGLSRQSLDNARNQLVQLGLIDYTSGTTRQAGRYKLFSVQNLIMSDFGQIFDKSLTNNGQVFDKSLTNVGQIPCTLLDVNLNKDINKDDVTRACEIYQNNIGPIVSEMEKDKVLDMASSYPLMWIEAAIEKAVLNNSRRLNYILGILKNWEKHGFNSTNKKAGGKNNAISSGSDDESVCEPAGEDNGSGAISGYYQGRKIF